MKLAYRVPKKARIEIIPLIDVVFFCLATFVLVTLAMNKTTTIPVSLPIADQTIRPADLDKALTIGVTATGEIYWNMEPLSWDQFVERISAYGRTETEPRVYINVDEGFKFGGGINLMNEIRKAGIQTVGVMTRTRPSERT